MTPARPRFPACSRQWPCWICQEFVAGSDPDEIANKVMTRRPKLAARWYSQQFVRFVVACLRSHLAALRRKP